MSDTENILSDEQKKKKRKLGVRALFSPSYWQRNNKCTLSKEEESAIIDMLLMINPEQVYYDNKITQRYESKVHLKMNIDVGGFSFWNSNHGYADASFKLPDKSSPAFDKDHIASRKIAIAFKDLMEEVRKIEEGKDDKNNISDHATKAIMDSIL